MLWRWCCLFSERSSVQVQKNVLSGSRSLGISGDTPEPGGKRATGGLICGGGAQISERTRDLQLAGQPGDAERCAYRRTAVHAHAAVSLHEGPRDGQGSDRVGVVPGPPFGNTPHGQSHEINLRLKLNKGDVKARFPQSQVLVSRATSSHVTAQQRTRAAP